ncbi:MAG: hypothetical protein QM770_19155 [Tepidisphaeraceae bacterium]
MDQQPNTMYVQSPMPVQSTPVDQPVTTALSTHHSDVLASLRTAARAQIADERQTLRAHLADPSVRVSAIFEAMVNRRRTFAHRMAGLMPRLEVARKRFAAKGGLDADRAETASNQLLNALDASPAIGMEPSREMLRRTVTQVASVGGLEATLLHASDHAYLDRLKTMSRELQGAGLPRFGWSLASHLIRLAWALGMLLLAMRAGLAGPMLLTILVVTYALIEAVVQPLIRATADREDRERLPAYIDRFYREAMLTQRSLDLSDDFIDVVRDQ